MLFWSRYRDPLYTITPDDYEYTGPGNRHRRKVAGLHVKFVPQGPNAGSTFDTTEAAAREGWDDETREHVEQRLMTSSDFGQSMHLLGQPDPVQIAAGVEDSTQRCTFMIPSSTGVSICGQPTLRTSKFCPDHELVMMGPGEPETDSAGRVSAPEVEPQPLTPENVIEVGADGTPLERTRDASGRFRPKEPATT